jgi:hypothetical protein
MTDSIEVIKNQFFSQDNMNFIMKIVSSKNINITTSHQILFNASNQIFNNFMHTVYTQKKLVNPNKIEDLLITLNKMVIDLILDNNKNLPERDDTRNSRIDTDTSIKDIHIDTDKDTDTDTGYSYIRDNQNDKIDGNNQIEKDIIVDNTDKEIVNYMDLTPKSLNSSMNVMSESLYIFSEDSEYNNGIYKLQFHQSNVSKICFDSFELLNDLYNITEYNNTFEVTEKAITKKISIPIGCYNLIDLLEIMEKCILEKLKDSKIKLTYNKHKNRIYITSEIPFSFHFIENDNVFIPLRFMLGFDKKEYMNNNNYCSKKEPALNIYDSIYIKILTLDNLNNHVCQDFKFYDRLDFDHINSFGNVVKITDINNVIHNMDIDNLSIELYYRHITHRKFYRINDRLKFTLKFNICK